VTLRPTRNRVLTAFVCLRPHSPGTYSLQNRNSLGQDPCKIVSILEAACRGQGKDFMSTHQSQSPEGTLSRDLEHPLTPLSQVRITSRRSTAPMATMSPPQQTRQISHANATPSLTGAPPLITGRRDMMSLQVRRIPQLRVDSLYMSCAACQSAQIYSFVLTDPGFRAQTDFSRNFHAPVGGWSGIQRATISSWHGEPHATLEWALFRGLPNQLQGILMIFRMEPQSHYGHLSTSQYVMLYPLLGVPPLIEPRNLTLHLNHTGTPGPKLQQ
jgi:hypothetical protein